MAETKLEIIHLQIDFHMIPKINYNQLKKLRNYLIKLSPCLNHKKKGYIFSAIKNSYPIQRTFFFDNIKGIRMINEKNYFKRSQEFQETFHDAGQFYWAHSQTWEKQKIIFTKNSKIFLLPLNKAHDIDTYDDWKLVQKFYKMQNPKKN